MLCHVTIKKQQQQKQSLIKEKENVAGKHSWKFEMIFMKTNGRKVTCVLIKTKSVKK